METIIQGIVDIMGALPDGPYFVFETPFPSMEQISNGGDTNFGSTFGDANFGSSFGDVNLPFGEDAIDVHTEESTDNSTDNSGYNITK